MCGAASGNITNMALKPSKTGLSEKLQELCAATRKWTFWNDPRRRSAVVNLFLNSLRNACKVNFPNILKNILNVKQPFTPACCVRTEITKRSLYYYGCTLTNYLDGISYLFTSKFFICTFFYLHYYQYQCDAYVFHSFSTSLCSGLPLITDSFLHLKGLPWAV